jgi:hypothetical protein
MPANRGNVSLTLEGATANQCRKPHDSENVSGSHREMSAPTTRTDPDCQLEAAWLAQLFDSTSYGANQRAAYFRLATYADRMLHGERPAELPIEQPTKFELVLNLGTAKVLGINIPPSVQVRADRVID